MIEGDTGGGFGARGEFYPEDFLVPFAARHVGRPVIIHRLFTDAV
jgi:carbon-monoxide dehydrogenase large subunit